MKTRIRLETLLDRPELDGTFEVRAREGDEPNAVAVDVSLGLKPMRKQVVEFVVDLSLEETEQLLQDLRDEFGVVDDSEEGGRHVVNK